MKIFEIQKKVNDLTFEQKAVIMQLANSLAEAKNLGQIEEIFDDIKNGKIKIEGLTIKENLCFVDNVRISYAFDFVLRDRAFRHFNPKKTITTKKSDGSKVKKVMEECLITSDLLIPKNSLLEKASKVKEYKRYRGVNCKVKISIFVACEVDKKTKEITNITLLGRIFTNPTKTSKFFDLLRFSDYVASTRYNSEIRSKKICPENLYFV